MIISHKHRFILLKPRKVAGTSILYAFSQICDTQSDIVGKIYNLEGYENPIDNTQILSNHAHPFKIIQHVSGQKVWDEYKKIVPIRNPWDIAVSSFFWCKKTGEWNNDNFSQFIRSNVADDFIKNNLNYYYLAGQLIPDYVVRYENLENDIQTILNNLGVESEVTIPKLKVGIRPEGEYQNYYNDSDVEYIRNVWQQYINDFGYEF
jgi:hypothetical protein